MINEFLYDNELKDCHITTDYIYELMSKLNIKELKDLTNDMIIDLENLNIEDKRKCMRDAEKEIDTIINHVFIK